MGDVLAVMRDLAAEGMTMLVVAHEMASARDVAVKAVLMDGGALVEEGPAAEMIGRPEVPRPRAFLSRVLNPTHVQAPGH